MPRILVLAVIVAGLVWAGWLGVRFRHWMWDTTAPMRFLPDINRSYDWGRKSATEGYLNLYEKVQAHKPDESSWPDCGPLRLAVMTAWGRWSLEHFPRVETWQTNRSYALTAPMLHFNMLMEGIGLASAFFLTRLWAIRGCRQLPMDRDSLRWFFRGCIPALLAVLLLWFNPAVVLSGYGWPTWDLWIIPMFLLAASLASVNWWFTAGAAIGIGAMFDGQQLFSIPMFVIWSLMLGRPLASLRFCCGCLIAVALVVSPWLVSYIRADAMAGAPWVHWNRHASFASERPFRLNRVIDGPALVWIAGVLSAAIALPFISWLTLEIPTGVMPIPRWRAVLASPWAWRALAAFATIALVMWPWLLKRNRDEWWMGCLAAAGLATATLCVRPRGIGYASAGATGIALLLCTSLFHGSTASYGCTFRFGSAHWTNLINGVTDNLPGILQKDFDWPNDDVNIALFTIPAGWLQPGPVDMPIGTFLRTMFWITTILCSVGVGMQARRQNARILIGLTAPWLMLFCFPAQVQERYLVFAAGVSCVCTGDSLGMTLLGIFLSIVTFLMTLHRMLVGATPTARRALGRLLGQQFPGRFQGNTGETLLRMLNGTHPDLGYAVMLCALIFLYFSLAGPLGAARLTAVMKVPE